MNVRRLLAAEANQRLKLPVAAIPMFRASTSTQAGRIDKLLPDGAGTLAFSPDGLMLA